MQKILQIIVAIICFVLFIWALGVGMKKESIRYCNNLVTQAEEYKSPFFYITRSEANMCSELGIFINAPVKVECVNGVSKDVPRCPIEE